MTRPVTHIPGELGCYLVASSSSALPWRVDLFYQEEDGHVLPTCACGIEYHRTDKYRSCRHIKQATEEHNSIVAGMVTDLSDLRRALDWSKQHRTWAKHWGPRPTVESVENAERDLAAMLALGQCEPTASAASSETPPRAPSAPPRPDCIPSAVPGSDSP